MITLILLLMIILILTAIIVVATLLFLRLAPQIGGTLHGSRLVKIESSLNYADGRFQNLADTPRGIQSDSRIEFMRDYSAAKELRRPAGPIPCGKPDYRKPVQQDGLRITWLGHSTVHIQIGEYSILVDPVFNPRPSPIKGFGPKVFQQQNPTLSSDIPDLNAIVISHDHYDHLDYSTIKELEPRTDRFIVPLGVGAHLERWGIDPSKIVELYWGESFDLNDEVKFTAAPSQHFSGRRPSMQNRTLWNAWVIKGIGRSVFFGGDSGYFSGFRDIGNEYGPFDVVMLDCGQYSKYWAAIHMHPEQVVQASCDLRGKVLLPIHWGKLNLSFHPWTEPIERVITELERRSFDTELIDGENDEGTEADELAINLKLATPLIGETFDPSGSVPSRKWWN